MNLKRIAVASGVVSLVLATAACGGSHKNADKVAAAPHGSASKNAAVQYPLPAKTALKNIATKAEMVKVGNCDQLKGGGQLASGTVKNSGTKVDEYHITVYFSDSKNHPVNWAATTVIVPPGKSVPWVSEKAFQHDGKLSCHIAAVS